MHNDRVLANEQFARCVVNREMPESGRAQDIRSVAYVMVEMLTGMRMRGHLLEREHLLSHVATNSMETRFLVELLQAASLTEVIDHPYLDRDSPFGHQPLGESNRQLQPQQGKIIAALTEQELTKCREQRRRHLSEIRVWLAQFERRNKRKPTTSERPKSVTLLQRRCRTLTDRIKELEARLSATRKSFYRRSEHQKDDDDDELENATKLDGSSSVPALSLFGSSTDSKMGILPTLDVAIRDEGDLSELYKRSPAQKAFLKRLATQSESDCSAETIAPGSKTSVAIREQYSAATFGRSSGQQLMRQRKEVLQVISNIADAK